MYLLIYLYISKDPDFMTHVKRSWGASPMSTCWAPGSLSWVQRLQCMLRKLVVFSRGPACPDRSLLLLRFPKAPNTAHFRILVPKAIRGTVFGTRVLTWAVHGHPWGCCSVVISKRALQRLPRGSRYLIDKELGLKDHDYYGFWGLSP